MFGKSKRSGNSLPFSRALASCSVFFLHIICRLRFSSSLVLISLHDLAPSVPSHLISSSQGPSSSYLKLFAVPWTWHVDTLYMLFFLSNILLFIIQNRIKFSPPAEPVCVARTSNKWSAPLFSYFCLVSGFPLPSSCGNSDTCPCSCYTIWHWLMPSLKGSFPVSHVTHTSLPLNLCLNGTFLMRFS